jgi:hypothetical protein
MIHPEFTSWNSKYINFFGLKNIGCLLFMKYIDTLNKNVPLIDLGSGNGYISQFLYQNGFQVIPIDPLIHGKFAPALDSIIFPPYHETVNQLIKMNPDIVGNNNLLLNWCNPNVDSYDYEAIHLLKPQNIVIITELTGASNSFKFHAWLRHVYPQFNSIKLMDQHAIPYKYIGTKTYSITDMHRLIGSLNISSGTYDIQLAIIKIVMGDHQITTDISYNVGQIKY